MLVTYRNNQAIDLAGYQYNQPNYFQTRQRINYLVNRYLSLGILYNRLNDLPTQFKTPHQRPWEPINWQAITDKQIIGVRPDLFINIIASAAEVEAPIRDYARESWDYLQAAHPEMARFVGGKCTADGVMQEVGVWEKEERQHKPVFSKIYQQITGEKLQPKPNSVAGFKSSSNPWSDIYNHSLSRITTEWSATSVYLWLMAHSTGELQQAIAQPLQDEVNHLAKFWGISYWAFGDSFLTRLQGTTKNLIGLFKHNQGERTHSNDILQISYALPSVELAFTFTRVMLQLYYWHKTLNFSYLEYLFGSLKNENITQSV
ncbi:MAG: ferritin-like domain-containing protein [Nostocaceae cyanobacterium]|nr:ferritin-like domain-containing protein [Nostocaceae cyanobacterium]